MSLDSAAWRNEVEGAVEFLSLIDPDDRLLYVNHVDTSDIFGVPVMDFISPEYRDLVRRSIDAARAEGFPQHYDSEAVTPDGVTAFYSNWIFPVLQAGTEGVVAFVATDVTEHRRMKSELERSDVTFRSVVGQAPDHIIITDRERRLTFVNHLEHGYGLADVIGRPIEEFVAPEDRDRVVAELESVIATGERTSYETTVHTPNGDRFFSTRAGPILVDGVVDGLVTVSTNITERLEAERESELLNAQLQQSQKMEALGQLTGGVAHDFNNLLTAISGNLELLEPQLAEDSAGAHRLKDAMRGITQAADLTRRLLVFARDQPMNAKPRRIDLLLEEMVPLLRRTLGESIDVRVTRPEELWPCAVDAGQFEQAIVNLAVNARDAMRSAGTLEIVGENMSRTNGITGHIEDWVVLNVRDTGFGMDPEVADQAFEPFFTTKGPGDGTGLGLSMVYGFVSQSGGRVSLDSKPGVGTTVRLEFPRVSLVGADAPDKEPPSMPRGAGEVVLVVEDQPRVREVCVLSLEQLGYTALEANDADEALAALDKPNEIAVVVSDLGLPGDMDGVELARHTAKFQPPLPTVLMSGYVNPALVEGDLPEGIRFLQKPFKLADLANAVADALHAP